MFPRLFSSHITVPQWANNLKKSIIALYTTGADYISSECMVNMMNECKRGLQDIVVSDKGEFLLKTDNEVNFQMIIQSHFTKYRKVICLCHNLLIDLLKQLTKRLQLVLAVYQCAYLFSKSFQLIEFTRQCTHFFMGLSIKQEGFLCSFLTGGVPQAKHRCMDKTFIIQGKTIILTPVLYL